MSGSAAVGVGEESCSVGGGVALITLSVPAPGSIDVSAAALVAVSVVLLAQAVTPHTASSIAAPIHGNWFLVLAITLYLYCSQFMITHLNLNVAFAVQYFCVQEAMMSIRHT